MPFFTIGHSTLPIGAFVEQLVAQHVATLADIRSIPGSNRHPQYNAENLSAVLADVGITVVHLAALGGRRNRQHAVEPERNGGWRNTSFHNYADYATTPDFLAGLAALIDLDGPVAYCCAEALPWRCHRTIVSDHLVARGHQVIHLMGTTRREHRLGAWGPTPLVDAASVTYPAEDDPTRPTSRQTP